MGVARGIMQLVCLVRSGGESLSLIFGDGAEISGEARIILVSSQSSLDSEFHCRLLCSIPNADRSYLTSIDKVAVFEGHSLSFAYVLPLFSCGSNTLLPSCVRILATQSLLWGIN